jgi:hypothetical protein
MLLLVMRSTQSFSTFAAAAASLPFICCSYSPFKALLLLLPWTPLLYLALFHANLQHDCCCCFSPGTTAAPAAAAATIPAFNVLEQ